MKFNWLTEIKKRDILFQRHRGEWRKARGAPICPRMTEVLDSNLTPSTRRRPPFDRLNVACLVWAGLFAAVTAGLVIVLR